MVKNLPAVQERWVQSLGQEEGNGNPLQHSCLENSIDRGTWQATVPGVAKSQTRLSDFHTLSRLAPRSILLWHTLLFQGLIITPFSSLSGFVCVDPSFYPDVPVVLPRLYVCPCHSLPTPAVLYGHSTGSLRDA